MSRIELHQIEKVYPTTGQKALDRLSLKIDSAEWIFLIGPSGAGKTTLLKLLYKAVLPDTGTIVIDGKDIRDIPAYRLRRQAGIIFQNFELIPIRTAAENVAYGAEILGRSPADVRLRTEEMLELVGLGHKRNSFPHELSGGEQQRVSIARALINRPRLILADEPTGDLDPENTDRIISVFEQIHREWQATLLFVTHAPEMVDRLQKRVIRLEHGRIVRDAVGGYHVPDPGPSLIDKPADDSLLRGGSQ